MQHERTGSVPVVRKPYDMDTLGAPFKVILHSGVEFGVDKQTGEETVKIPDTIGLINAVVRARVCHKRKLNGSELKFIRKALGVKAKIIAEFLDMTAEHFSRCESGQKVMSAQAEKLFRMAAFSSSFLKNPEDMFNRNIAATDMPMPTNVTKKAVDSAIDLVKSFITMKIEAFHSPSEKLVFHFWRRKGPECVADDEDNWSDRAAA
ncbi:hypothetical protein [Methylocystis sp. B8]|uniref:hypothetical protein n=1 Tax=Methylocystis sp. B8 TaxID=544938 RepID=UPI0010FD8377|nr:hypothetical protein [Methylocystis sp. B8]TLG78598.1 hypothetical protein FEV16_00715 [Methylocystis sp. B8]